MPFFQFAVRWVLSVNSATASAVFISYFIIFLFFLYLVLSMVRLFAYAKFTILLLFLLHGLSLYEYGPRVAFSVGVRVPI